MMGKSHNWGSMLGYMKANVEYGLCHASLNGDFPAYL
jgi:UTP--glucose-1-phosphate uridylyltransferase